MTITMPQTTGNESNDELSAIFASIRQQLLEQAPQVEGTEAQIEWANDIRAKCQLTGEVCHLIVRSRGAARVVRMAEIVMSQPAEWWIEHRETYGDVARNVLGAVATAHKDELMQIA